MVSISRLKIFSDAFFFPERTLKERKAQMEEEDKKFTDRIERIKQKRKEEYIEFHKQLLKILQMP